MKQPPYPSLADGLWPTFYPLMVVGMLVAAWAGFDMGHPAAMAGGRGRCHQPGRGGSLLSLSPIAENVTGSSTAILVNLAYP